MTDNNHTITPPPKLIEDWIELSRPSAVGYADPNKLAAFAAQWGSDQELEACCGWVSQFDYDDYSYGERLRAARRGRPKPPTLKVAALAVLDDASDRLGAVHENIIRRALESLPE